MKKYALALSLSCISLGYAATWTGAIDNMWNNDGNWTMPSTFPNTPSDQAILGDAIAADTTITLGQNISIDRMDIFNAAGNAYSIAPGNSLTIAGGSMYSINMNAPAAGKTIQIQCPLIFTSTTNEGNIFLNVGGLFQGNAEISGNLTLANANTAHQFLIGNGGQASDLIMSGVISGGISGGFPIQKFGTGTLEFSGSAANTFAPRVSVAQGELLLNKTAGVAIPGQLDINPIGIVTLGAQAASNNQISNTSVMRLEGVFNMNSHPTTMGGLRYFNTGSITNIATITLASGTTPLEIVNGASLNVNTVILSGGGKIYASGAGMATLSGAAGNVNLSGNLTNIDVEATQLTISKVIANGSINKTNTGTLILTAANTYAGGSTISEGIMQLSGMGSLASTGAVNIPVSGATFDIAPSGIGGATIGDLTGVAGSMVQLGANTLTFGTATSSATFSGDINDAGMGGNLIKQGSGMVILNGNSSNTGNTSLNAGTLAVNGTLGGNGPMTTAAGTTLQGNGTISKLITLNGTLSPGNSIDTINLVGNQTFASGSTLLIELNPTTSDLVNITGNLTIQGGATLSIVPERGFYSGSQIFTIVQTTTGVNGTFSNFINSFPTLRASVVYNPLNIQLILDGFTSFSTLFTGGNLGAIAAALDSLADDPCSNLDDVLVALHFLPTLSELKSALLQLQPSLFTSLAVAQENATLNMRKTIYDRLEQPMHSCIAPNSEKLLNIWISAIGARTSQRNAQHEPGFLAYSPGTFLGFDARFANRTYFGGGIGYTYTHLDWKQKRGNSDLQTAYGAIYARWATPRFFLQSALMGGYNFYHTHRKIAFDDISATHVTAKGEHNGQEGSASAKAGAIFTFAHGWAAIPFVSVDYIFIHEDSFREKGAKGLNLKLKSKNSDLLNSEAGIDFSRCFSGDESCYTPFLKLSAIRESRFYGKKEKASFACGDSFTVHGLYPSRTLGAIAAGLDASFSNHAITLSYLGKFRRKYNDQSVDFVYRYQF